MTLRQESQRPCCHPAWHPMSLAARRVARPIAASSGDHVRHRLSRAGNRQINRTLHLMARVQLRNQTEGRRYHDRKKTASKSSMEAMRCLKRRLSDLVYKTMLDDAIRQASAGEDGSGRATGRRL